MDKIKERMLNTQYAVFFGAIVTLLFLIDNTQQPPLLRFAVADSNVLLVGVLILYYIFDWFTFNVFDYGESIGWFALFLNVLSVMSLGMIVIWMNSESVTKYLFFGLHGIGAAIWDLAQVMSRTGSTTRTEDIRAAELTDLMIGSQRFCLSLVLTTVSALLLLYGDPQHDYLPRLAGALIAAIVLMKLFRLLHFASRRGNSPREIPT